MRETKKGFGSLDSLRLVSAPPPEKFDRPSRELGPFVSLPDAGHDLNWVEDDPRVADWHDRVRSIVGTPAMVADYDERLANLGIMHRRIENRLHQPGLHEIEMAVYALDALERIDKLGKQDRAWLEVYLIQHRGVYKPYLDQEDADPHELLKQCEAARNQTDSMQVTDDDLLAEFAEFAAESDSPSETPSPPPVVVDMRAAEALPHALDRLLREFAKWSDRCARFENDNLQPLRSKREELRRLWNHPHGQGLDPECYLIRSKRRSRRSATVSESR